MPARLLNVLTGTWLIVFIAGSIFAVGIDRAMAAPYVVIGVPVDVTAADAATARDEAILQGQRKAFDMLMEQLLGTDRAATMQKPSDAQLSAMVQDFQVESERLSTVRYIGVLTFRFDEESIDAVIGKPADSTEFTIGAVPSGPVQTLGVSVPIGSLRDWVEVRRRLAGIPAVQRAEVRALARTEGELNLVYYGDETQLVQVLAQSRLSLTQNAQEWVLRLAEYGDPTTGNP
jgi:hypothetical protein